jgi:hypothetical protein
MTCAVAKEVDPGDRRNEDGDDRGCDGDDAQQTTLRLWSEESQPAPRPL